MIIIGAKGFAKELLQILDDNGTLENSLHFYDDISNDLPDLLYGKYLILRSPEQLKEFFHDHSTDFILGIGGPAIRCDLSQKALMLGGKLTSIVSRRALISRFAALLEDGLCIMQNAIIENDTKICEGSLIHNNVMISHGVQVGKYCEVSPGAKLLGNVTVGEMCLIGSNAVILPNLSIGNNVRVGAGAVVTKNILDDKTVTGIPAREI